MTEDFPRGWRRFVYSTNHRDIGTMFLVFALFAGLCGTLLALAVRAELFEPGLQVFASVRAGAVALTGHGICMIFFCVLPAVTGFGAWLVPLTIGAPSLAFPRMSNLAFWLLPFAFVLFALSFAVPGGDGGNGVSIGWHMLAPMASYGAPGPAVDFVLAALCMAALSLVLSSVGFIVTILNMRAPRMSLNKMPLFAWAMLVSSFLALASLPALFCAYFLLFADRHFGTTLFNAAGGGNPLLYQNMFWLFGHAVGLIVVLPAVGVVGHVIEAFSRRQLFARLSAAYAMVAAAAIGLFGWGQHMPVSDFPVEMSAVFLLAGLAVTVPLAVLIFTLVATMRGGSLIFRAPMVWAIGFIPVFALGVLSGAILSGTGAETILHGTVYETAQSHFFVGLSAYFAFSAGWYFWFPKFTGRLYSEILALLQFGLAFVGVLIAFVPLFFLGLAGMPQGMIDTPDVYAGWNGIAGIGAAIYAGSILLFFVTLLDAFWKNRRAGDNPWGRGATGIEWTLPSPPPYRTFDELPKVR